MSNQFIILKISVQQRTNYVIKESKPYCWNLKSLLQQNKQSISWTKHLRGITLNISVKSSCRYRLFTEQIHILLQGT